MQSATQIRLITLASFALAAMLPAQSSPNPAGKPSAAASPLAPSTLPATSSTSTTVSEPALTPAQQQPKRAQITYSNGSLSVSADNASLNQILRQISHDTGMKITGGVMDERVFGQYGPAPSSQILAALLDGTASNMLFVDRNGTTPAELILTPRQGAPTPPNPNASVSDDKADSDEPPPSAEPTQPAAEGTIPQRNTLPPPPALTPSDATQADSPNGVKTPQQIYDQLQRMRQQQQAPQQ